MTSARAGRAVSGERRVITMLFCDVIGSTAMADQLDPEEWAEIMNEAFEYLLAPVYRYEGTIARLQGDGFLAFFGAPVAHEDDPVRAVLCGLEIQQDLEPFKEEIREDYGLEFNVRVGINTGPVVVGDIGSEQALEYTAMGDAINLAARMEATAAPGTVQIAEYTYRLVAPLFEVESLGAIEIKGKDEPVAAYRVLRRKERPGRLRGIEGLDAPLVGRDGEISQLRSLLEDLRAGRGQIVFLIGEAGLGKSRLLSEMEATWRQEPGSERYWTTAQGIPYETGRPYSLFYQRMRNNMGIEDGDAADVVRRKIERSLSAFPAGQKAAVSQAVETLLAVEGRGDGLQLEAEALKRQLFELTTQVWKNEGLTSPSVAVFDDLHWSDAASAELIIHLLALVEQAPVMILCAMRPYEDSPGWQVRQAAFEMYRDRTSEFSLGPLGDEDSNELVDHLLVVADLPPELRRLIQEKAEGNPFFVEEVVRTLIDSGAIVRDDDGRRWRSAQPVETLAIPENLQAMLTSRIDRLEKQTKQTLQMASVIGRRFYKRILAQVAERVQMLDEELAALQRADLILQAAGHPGGGGRHDIARQPMDAGQPLDAGQPADAYIFRHELTREATYQTLLRRQRRRYHRRAGEAIETIFADRLNEEAHRLAYHFGQAGDKARAMKYHEIAGDQATRLYANKEAAEHYAGAIKLARDGGDEALLIRLYEKRGKVLGFDGRFDEALAGNQELEALAREIGAPNLALQAIADQGTLFAMPSVMFNAKRAKILLDKAQQMAEELGNEVVEAKIQWSLMMANNYMGGTPEVSLAYGQRSLALARKHQLEEQLAYTLHDIARPLSMLGRFDQALEYSEEAGRLFREQGNMPMVVDNIATASSGYFLLGQLERSLDLAQEALELSRRIGSLWGESYAIMRSAFVLAEMGYVGRAISSWQEAGKVAKEANFIGYTFFIPAFTAMHVLTMGACDRGEQLLHDLREERRQNQESDSGVNALRMETIDDSLARVESLAHLCRGDIDAAQRMLPPQRPETSSNLLDAATFGLLTAADCRVLLASGNYEEARKLAARACDTMDRIGIKVAGPALLQADAEALLALDQPQEATAKLRRAAEDARAMNARRQLWPVLGVLARLADADGEASIASALRQEARACIELIASDLDEDWRRDFLALPEVRQAGGFS